MITWKAIFLMFSFFIFNIKPKSWFKIFSNLKLLPSTGSHETLWVRIIKQNQPPKIKISVDIQNIYTEKMWYFIQDNYMLLC